ncbi:aldose epimerase family protein [Mucilaginibacter sp. dw_454]|uniref:aldose epimerase family protein n=1 Tax=Mucilaginibacter sp. dw_454 TaxID=2720079 RepID=UPI001BD6D304|nr:aldose epimerase family protein [Mucilaginibacter sp. dw_454]
MSTTITCKAWGTTQGTDIFLFMLTNSSGAFVEVCNYGATLVSVKVPGKDGKLGNAIIGFPTLESYLDDNCYIGSTIGRYANRVSKSQFTLNEEIYQLEANDGVNSNHSASSGFNSKVFGFEVNDDELVMVLHSHDGDGGYPGNLNLRITYKWSDDNELSIRYKAVSDKDTYANFTNHAYFNLSDGDLTVLDHQIQINADKIVAAGGDYIPTGKIIPAAPINLDAEKGINSYYILNDDKSFAAKLIDQLSGRALTVNTSYPGIFLYTGDYLNSKHLNLNNRYCQPFEGLCLECQHYPDSMNRPEFPSALLPKHHVYDEFITFKFDVI